MKILVTGASGFIGSNLTEKLISKGNEVIGIDKDFDKRKLLSPVIPNKEKMYQMQINKISKTFSMIWDDINKIESYHYAFDGVEEIYHLAASADIKRSFNEPTMDFKNNVQGTNKILEIVRKKDIKRLIFSSSSAVYGEAKVLPTPEDLPNMKPISLYGSSKLANEAFIHAYSDLYGIKAWSFRFGNVIGRHEHRGVIPDFYKKLQENKRQLEILGDGNQKKSYFDVDDCISGLTEIPKKDGNKGSEIYNLGYEKSIKVIELADIVCDEMGLEPDYVFTGGDRGWIGDVPIVVLDIKKAINAGWKIKYDTEEAIRRAVRYFKGEDK